LEEHRIPVDIIVGTSAGGLVGGAYAAGWTPDELRALMKSVDWDLMFLADSPFKYKTFRRKEDARAFPGQIDFGLKGGFKLPAALNAGQQIQLMLDRIALPYYDLQSFDDLPTPYRAVATDLRKSEVVVFNSGQLSQAMRATMAIPGVFTPVVDGERVLVDGGVLNNVPADVVRKSGADFVVAVNVGSHTDAPPPPANLFDILSQTIDAFMTSGVNSSLKFADLVIVPKLKGYFGLDWRKVDDIAKLGYDAAEAEKDTLLKFQVDEATYEDWKRARATRRRTELPVVTSVRVSGVKDKEAQRIGEYFEHGVVGQPFDRLAVETGVLRVTGTDRYEVIRYRLTPASEGASLLLDVTPKSYGPPFLLPAFDLENVDSNAFAANFRFRVAFYDTLVGGSEIRLDFGIGTRQFIAGELYRRLRRTKLFVAPRAYFDRSGVNAYNNDDELIAEYRLKRTGLGGDVGYEFSPRSELRAGFDVADVRARRRVGEPVLPEASGTERVASIRWAFDDQNSPLVPSRGLYLRTSLSYYFSSPDIVTTDGQTILRIDDYPQAAGLGSWFTRIGGRNRFFTILGGGTSFGHDPGINEFRLGGPFRLGAFNNQQITGDNFVLAVGGVLHEWFRLPDVLGGNVYYGGWFENGSAFDDWDRARYRGDVSAGVFVETIIGPMFLAGSVSVTDGSHRFYVSLAPLR
jgi:NTE family protein